MEDRFRPTTISRPFTATVFMTVRRLATFLCPDITCSLPQSLIMLAILMAEAEVTYLQLRIHKTKDIHLKT